jgi:hypothetical protein
MCCEGVGRDQNQIMEQEKVISVVTYSYGCIDVICLTTSYEVAALKIFNDVLLKYGSEFFVNADENYFEGLYDVHGEDIMKRDDNGKYSFDQDRCAKSYDIVMDAYSILYEHFNSFAEKVQMDVFEREMYKPPKAMSRFHVYLSRSEMGIDDKINEYIMRNGCEEKEFVVGDRYKVTKLRSFETKEEVFAYCLGIDDTLLEVDDSYYYYSEYVAHVFEEPNIGTPKRHKIDIYT